MPRRQTPAPSTGVRILVLFLIVVLVLGLIYGLYLVAHSRPQIGAGAPAPTPGLVSDDRIIYGGIPRPKNPDVHLTVLKNIAYMVGYSEARKDPLWSAYRVKKEQPFDLPRPKGNFLTDDRTIARIEHSDYTRTGYDRGHMTPNSAIARCYGAAAQRETFLLSNIVPQSAHLNREVWEHLEAAELDYAKQAGELWVVDGPVFSDMLHPGEATRQLKAGIAIPEACYKILLEDASGGAGTKIRVFAVIIPQSVKGTENPAQFVTSIRNIEDDTGLEFLWKLPAAQRQALENQTAPMWPIPR